MKPIILISFSLLLILSSHAALAVITEDEKEDLLNSHNSIRIQVARGTLGSQPSATNMIRLEWDEDLSNIAQKHVENCQFEFNSDRGSQYQMAIGSSSPVPVGENVYRNQLERGVLIKEAMRTWVSGQENYNYNNMNSCNSTVNPCGFYTQIAWANTQKLGCGITFCKTLTSPFSTMDNMYFLTCDYFPAGNFFGQFPYEAGNTASNCPIDFLKDNDGLCSRIVESITNVEVPLPLWSMILLGCGLIAVAFKIQRVLKKT